MVNAVLAVARGIGAQENANLQAQTAVALFAISLVASVLPLRQVWSGVLALDALLYKNDLLRSTFSEQRPPDPSKPNYPHNGSGKCMAAVAAADLENKAIDTNQSNQEIGCVENLVKTAQAHSEYLGGVLGQVFNLSQPLFELLNQAASLIKSIPVTA